MNPSGGEGAAPGAAFRCSRARVPHNLRSAQGTGIDAQLLELAGELGRRRHGGPAVDAGQRRVEAAPAAVAPGAAVVDPAVDDDGDVLPRVDAPRARVRSRVAFPGGFALAFVERQAQRADAAGSCSSVKWANGLPATMHTCAGS